MNSTTSFVRPSVPIFTVCSYDRSSTVLLTALALPCLDVPITNNNGSCGSFFWSGSPNANNTNNAWGVNFNNGNVNNDNRNNDKSVRLVRGGE